MSESENNDRKSTRIKKKLMLEALQQTLGVVSAACMQVGIERKTHYRWMESDKKYKAEVEDLTNVALDFAESKLLGQIKSNNTAATIFYLKTKGKKRGYVEQIEHTGKDGKELETTAMYILPDGTKVSM